MCHPLYYATSLPWLIFEIPIYFSIEHNKTKSNYIYKGINSTFSNWYTLSWNKSRAISFLPHE